MPLLEAPSSGGEAASAAQQQRLPDRKSRCWSIWVERVNRLVSDMKQRTGIEVSIRSASEFLDILEFLRRSGRNQAAISDHDPYDLISGSETASSQNPHTRSR